MYLNHWTDIDKKFITMTIFRADLYACKRGVDFSFVGWTHPKVKWDNFQLKGDRYDPSKHDATTCQICIVAKWTPIGKAKISPTAKPRGDPSNTSQDSI